MIKKLHKMGIKSNHMYLAGLGSIALSFATWLASKEGERAGIDRADRWGIFVGQWAPTFFAMGVALRIEETHQGEEDMPEGMRGETHRTTDRIRAGSGV